MGSHVNSSAAPVPNSRPVNGPRLVGGQLNIPNAGIVDDGTGLKSDPAAADLEGSAGEAHANFGVSKNDARHRPIAVHGDALSGIDPVNREDNGVACAGEGRRIGGRVVRDRGPMGGVVPSTTRPIPVNIGGMER